MLRKPKPHETVTPQQVIAFRTCLGGSEKEAAKSLRVRVRTLRKWEAGTAIVPRWQAAEIRYTLALDAREQAAKRDGIEDCAWKTDQIASMTTALGRRRYDEMTRLGKIIEAHAVRCGECIRVQEWISTQPLLPPSPPLFRGAQVLDRCDRWVKSLPEWMRPAIYGAVFYGGICAPAVLGMMVLSRLDPARLREGLFTWCVTFALGALAGVTWRASRRVVRPLGRVAPYAAGTLIAAVCGPLAALAFEPGMLADGWVTLIPMSVIIGLILGYAILRHMEPEA